MSIAVHLAARRASDRPVLRWPHLPATVLRDESSAVEAAHRMAARFAREALERDRDRRLPWELLDDYGASGLWTLTVPRSHGGPGLSHAVVARVIAILAAADPSLAQILNSAYHAVTHLQGYGDEAQQRHYFSRMLAGERWGNASAQSGVQRRDGPVRLHPAPDGLRLGGAKFFATGALYSHVISVTALDDHDEMVRVMVPHDAPGLHIADDWDGFGQRTTASGTVELDDVAVRPEQVLKHDAVRHGAPVPPIADLIHSAVDTGIARAALTDAIAYLKARQSVPPAPARPSAAACSPAPSRGEQPDPFVAAQLGELMAQLHACDAMLERAGLRFDRALADRNDAEAVRASNVALAEVKVLSTKLSLEAGSALIQLTGATATRAAYGFDRHWRNARTHTVHDPVTWKAHAIGLHYLSCQ